MSFLKPEDTPDLPDPSKKKFYGSFVAKLQFVATWVRFNISFAVPQLARFAHQHDLRISQHLTTPWNTSPLSLWAVRHCNQKVIHVGPLEGISPAHWEAKARARQRLESGHPSPRTRTWERRSAQVVEAPGQCKMRRRELYS